MELGNVKTVSIVEEMTGAYLDYSMSVIVSRALPDVRDGLKPVHRRVHYAIVQMGLQSTKSFRKCAGTVAAQPLAVGPRAVAERRAHLRAEDEPGSRSHGPLYA